jgi:hypothetical protein
LSLESAPDAIERLLAVAVDDKTFDTAALRGLARTIGLGAPQARAPVASALHQRVLARLRAEDWYDDLLATAKKRKGAPPGAAPRSRGSSSAASAAIGIPASTRRRSRAGSIN